LTYIIQSGGTDAHGVGVKGNWRTRSRFTCPTDTRMLGVSWASAKPLCQSDRVACISWIL